MSASIHSRSGAFAMPLFAPLPLRPLALRRVALRRVALAVVAAASLGAASSASAITYSSLVTFGDSLSDAGNASALSGGNFPPTALGYAQRFSNGPVAAEILAGSTTLGWPAATAASNNYAVGGAMWGDTNYNVLAKSPFDVGARFPGLIGTGIHQQILKYAATAPVVQPDTLFLLWGGANDLFYGFAKAKAGLTVDFTQLITDAMGAVAGNVTALVALGAKHILMPNLPDLGLTPDALAAGAAFSGQATALTNAYNGALSFTMAALEGSPVLQALGVDLIGYDAAKFLRDTVADPAARGFTDVTHTCLSGGAAALASGCAGYLFFDGVHPTTAADQLLAREFATAAGAQLPISAVPEPETWALMLMGLGAMGVLARRRRDQRKTA
jgi:phospholipase/lecithinase/hemolysin